MLVTLLFIWAAEAVKSRGVRGRVRSVAGRLKGRKLKSYTDGTGEEARDSSEGAEAMEPEGTGEDAVAAEEKEKDEKEDDKEEDDKEEDMKEDAKDQVPAEDSGLEQVRVSIQPAYHGIPVYLGVELGLYEAMGLDVNISVFTSGGPQVAAAAQDEAWDFGVAGSVPNILAAFQDISTIGISNDESSANQLVGGPGVEEFPPTGEVTAGAFAVSPGSTGDLMLRRCLEAYGVAYNATDFLGGSPDDVTAALESGNSQYGALWAPNSYVYLDDNDDAQEFCNGESVGLTITGGLMVRDDWGKENPDLAAKTLAVYLHGVALMQNLGIRDKILEHARGFYDFVGKNPSNDDIERDFLTRPTFNLDATLGLMSRNFVNDKVSTLDHIYNDVANFMKQEGAIEDVPDPEQYLNDEYLQMISEDPDLRFFAYGGYSASTMGPEVTTIASVEKRNAPPKSNPGKGL